MNSKQLAPLVRQRENLPKLHETRNGRALFFATHLASRYSKGEAVVRAVNFSVGWEDMEKRKSAMHASRHSPKALGNS
jgi:hypothetical protein